MPVPGRDPDRVCVPQPQRQSWSLRTLVLACGLLGGMPVHAQQRTAPVEGLRTVLPGTHALTGARIWLAPGQVVENGTVVIQDGAITAVGTQVRIPAGAEVIDVGGRTLYPAFIDLASDYGVDPAGACTAAAPAAPPAGGGRRRFMGGGEAQATTPTAAAPRHWNAKVCSEREVASRIVVDAEKAKSLRSLGFGAVLAAPKEGVLRGQSALLSLRPDADANTSVLAANVAQHAALEQVSGFGGQYPGSLMGAHALLRQALLDARWQQAAHRAKDGARMEYNVSLVALEPLLAGTQPLVFHARDELDLDRGARLAREFGLHTLLVGTGSEYRRVDALKQTKLPVVLPLNFPAAPEVNDDDAGLDRSLVELEHWQAAPANAARLQQAGVQFALTADGLEKPAEGFVPALRKAIKAGLSVDAAVLALSATPAQWLGREAVLGRIAVGQHANLLVADGDWLSGEGKLYQVWVEGRQDTLAELSAIRYAGRWQLPQEAVLEISAGDKPSFKLGEDTLSGSIEKDRLRLTLSGTALGAGAGAGQGVLSARREGDTLRGRWLDARGVAIPFSATRIGDVVAEPGKDPSPDTSTAKATPPITAAAPSSATARYPAGEYGRITLPQAPSAVLFQGATVWMTGADQPQTDTDVLVRNGRIAAVGTGLQAPAGAVVIDARGKHLTPGLIDAHSHIAVSGNVNEPSHSVTSEVRIGDVIDPTDIDIYRQLAGGLTAAHILHGSANTIGGQAQLIKLRWGADAEGLKFAGATPTIKFALGENPKQANWGDNFRSRYPQTRMGVEQLLRDSFNAAREYAAAKAEAGRRKQPFRTDLRLEALAEVLAGQRIVHIHSYRADEILMFARLAQDYAIPTAVFQHVLEGYKVAPELAAGGYSTSSFADWWGYKLEVYDGIPHNNALLSQAGVIASTNSDSNDLARRMNTEAAKAMRYGGLTPVQALALVTTNPARQLKVDDRIGSVRAGLDADLVLWSASPLSAYARVEQTWIDGAKYFDRADDAAEQARIHAERARLIELARAESKDAAAGGKGKGLPGRRPPGLAFQLDLSRGLPTDWRALRPIYHDGEPVHLCRAGE